MRKYTQEEIEQDEKVWRAWWDNPEAVNYRRILKSWERKKRGCDVCAHLKRETREEAFGDCKGDEFGLKKNERLYLCTFSRCPLHEMDKYRNYGEYCRAERSETDRILKKLFNIKVKKATKRKKEKRTHKILSDKKKWLIWCRHSQGYDVDQIAIEFEISEEQAKEVIQEYGH